MTAQIYYPFYQICIECGRKYGNPLAHPIRVWEDLCPVCGRTTRCAIAYKDFSVFNVPTSIIKRENLFKFIRSKVDDRANKR